jgi:hypothetical protein
LNENGLKAPEIGVCRGRRPTLAASSAAVDENCWNFDFRWLFTASP